MSIWEHAFWLFVLEHIHPKRHHLHLLLPSGQHGLWLLLPENPDHDTRNQSNLPIGLHPHRLDLL
jgi:hypothetical protein